MINLPSPKPSGELGQYNPFGLGFRPFFLLASLWALVAIVLWAMLLSGGADFSLYVDAHTWHQHEMMLGFGSALAAGFLLTAVRNWTKLKTPTGYPLAGLAGLWLLGRLVWLWGANMPTWLVVVIDMAFLPWLLYAIGQPIWRRRQINQWPFVAVLIGLIVANASIHFGVIEHNIEAIRIGETLAIYALLGLLVTMAGRITPFFTERGCNIRLPVTPSFLVKSYVVVFFMVALLSLTQTLAPLMAVLSFTAGLLFFVQLVYWQTWRTLRFPLVWILHLGYSGIAIGFMLNGLASIDPIWTSSAHHAWMVLAMGGIGFGMMARVSLGHSGRLLTVLPGIQFAFILMIAAGVARVSAPYWTQAIYVSAALWSLAFAIMLWRYVPIWLQTRIDGQAD